MRNYSTSVYEYTNKNGLKVVKAVTQYAGKYVSASATLCPGDEYNAEFGKRLALLRLDQKIALKRAASMKRRASMYKKLIEDFESQVRTMKKEVEKAVICEGDRRVEAANIGAEIYKLTHEA